MPLARFLKADTADTTAAAKPCPEPTHPVYNNQDARVGYDSFFRCFPLDPDHRLLAPASPSVPRA